MSIYKACDIRGLDGAELTVEHATRLGVALARLQGASHVIVAGDGRPSTPELKHALIDSLATAGMQVVDLGIVPTPVFYFARQRLGILTGVMVTASHNPAGYNGFKITLGELPITPRDMQRIEQIMEGDEPAPGGADGGVEALDILPDYLAFAHRQMPDLAGLQVVVDCSNGVASLAARELWEASGAQVRLLHETIDGTFPNHPPNPAVQKNLAILSRAVQDAGADLGVAYDGDGDRIAFVDGAGQPLPSDKAIVIFARHVLQGEAGPIVYDQKCSRIVPDAIIAGGGEPIRERSGHTFIKTAFLSHKALYAGELSGHHFLRAFGGDDALLGSLLMAQIVCKAGGSLAALADGIETYASTPDIRLPMDEEVVSRVLRDLEQRLIDRAELSFVDGIRAEFSDGWGMARPSVTEPAVTLRFEGWDQAALQRIIGAFTEAAPDLAGPLAGYVKS